MIDNDYNTLLKKYKIYNILYIISLVLFILSCLFLLSNFSFFNNLDIFSPSICFILICVFGSLFKLFQYKRRRLKIDLRYINNISNAINKSSDQFKK